VKFGTLFASKASSPRQAPQPFIDAVELRTKKMPRTTHPSVGGSMSLRGDVLNYFTENTLAFVVVDRRAYEAKIQYFQNSAGWVALVAIIGVRNTGDRSLVYVGNPTELREPILTWLDHR
jgi:hypothetical protein